MVGSGIPSRGQRSLSWEGKEVMVILIGASSCGFTADSSTRQAFYRIVSQQRMRVKASNGRVATVGIAIDEDVASGLEGLRAFGRFDEMNVGRGWLNTGATHYAVRDIAGVLMVPQVLVVVRQVSNGGKIHVSDDSLEFRLAGMGEITEWARRIESESGRSQ
jgi:hypothetical protein